MHDEWADALAALIADKTRQAQAATLPPYETELSAPSAGAVALGNAWSERLFDGPFFLTPTHSDRPACSLVFVQSADGNTGARDPATLGGGDTDKHVIYEGLSRVAADAVLAVPKRCAAAGSSCRSGILSSSRCAPRSASRDTRRRSSRHCAESISIAV